MAKRLTTVTLENIEKQLRSCGIENARNESLLLVSHFMNISKSELLFRRSENFENDRLSCAIERRCSHYPLQYILGEWDFMGLTFKVNENCLIPRSDTELLSELAIEKLPENGNFLDLCTGSGCIAVSVAHFRKDVRVSALEKFENTLRVAKENCKNLAEGRVRLVLGDATSTLDAQKFFGDEKFDFIASNPPYVTRDEMTGLEKELSFEPVSALTDGGDGLSIIKGIVEVYGNYLTDGGYLAIEHGESQGPVVRTIIESCGQCAVTIQDLSGHDRVTYFKKI